MLEKEAEAPFQCAEASLSHPPEHGAGADQSGVLVERTGLDRVDGQRVDWIVLEDRDGAVLAQRPPHFRKQRHVLRRADMMEHAGGERHVEAMRSERQRRTVEMREIRQVAEACARDVQAPARNVDADDLGIRKMSAQVDDGVADPATEIEDRPWPGHPPPSQRSLSSAIL